MFIIIFVPMNKVKLLVHRREVSIEQQQVVQARVIWYVPCTHQRNDTKKREAAVS